MNALSNVFSVLRLDDEDDCEHIATAARVGKLPSKSDKTKDSCKRLGEDVAPHSDKFNMSSLSLNSGEYRMPLVWIDLEMTGLNVEVDRILEIACVVTDGKLIKQVEGPDLVIRQTKECLDSMGDWCRSHHAASGLTKRVLRSKISEQDAEKQKYMPRLAGIFPHVLVDVSSVMALCTRWFPGEKKLAPLKKKTHRAMDDIKGSIRELKYYKKSIFKT